MFSRCVQRVRTAFSCKRLTSLFEGDEGRRFDEVLVEEGAEFGRIVVDIRQDEGAAQSVHHLILLAVSTRRSSGAGCRGTTLFDAIEHEVMSDAHYVSVVHRIRHSTFHSLLVACEIKTDVQTVSVQCL